MEKMLLFRRIRLLCLGITRYILGIAMFPYALSKIFRTQFVTIGSTWTLPLESLPGTQLAWAFFGHSGWFQVLLGFLELIPAILLFFRKTTLLGAILMLPVTLNVVLINFALDLWPGTKIISAVLLTLNLLVLIFEREKISTILNLILSKGAVRRFPGIEFLINSLVILATGYFFAQQFLDYRSDSNELTGEIFDRQPIEWTLRDERIGDSILAPCNLKLYFLSYHKIEEIGDCDESHATAYYLEPKKHTLKIKYADSTTTNSKYTIVNKLSLTTERVIDSKKNLKLVQSFSGRVMNKKLELT